ncbi:hypothetical protein [Allocoleopsis sp.]|uniref:hypothetical protein n=1 Tax=Allocoleopsis sp. TaxID=3088169 RepID=UPI002FCF04F3
MLKGFAAISVSRLRLERPKDEVKPIGDITGAKGIAESGIGRLTRRVKMFVKKQ